MKKGSKKSLYAVFLFYFWIAFEFAYMAGPYAAFFYGAYSPILNFLNNIPILSFTTHFFLPHVVRETSSAFINVQLYIGAVLAISGLIMFIIGAIRIYASKLRKKGAVTKGIYKYVRHPQYSAFIISSFGMLLIWPRYIVLIGFVTVLFVYRILAGIEENECLDKFGDTYREYMNNTGRFFPRINKNKKIVTTKKQKWYINILIYLLALGGSLLLAYFVQSYTINSLYASYTQSSATISLCEREETEISHALKIAMEDTQVQELLNDTEHDIYLNYIMPTTWFAAEVPMNGIQYGHGHSSKSNYDRKTCKIIITRAEINKDNLKNGKEILTSLKSRKGLVEVWINLEINSVIDVYSMPENIKYDGIPEAIY